MGPGEGVQSKGEDELKILFGDLVEGAEVYCRK